MSEEILVVCLFGIIGIISFFEYLFEEFFNRTSLENNYKDEDFS